MRFLKRFAFWALPLALLHAQPPSFAKFQGSGSNSIQALASDGAGNIYVAGTTAASDLPMKNAMQPQIGEAPLMRSTNGGQTWQKLPNVPAGTLEVAPPPAHSQVLLIAGENGIDKSIDGGQNWQHVHSWRAESYAIVNIAIDPANPALAYALMKPSDTVPLFLVSTNGGETWQERAMPRSITAYSPSRQLFVDPHGSGTVILGMATSLDRGLTWRMMAYPANGTHARSLRTDPYHPGWFYVLTATGATNYLYLSTDWGATWTEKTGFADLTFDPDLPNVLYSITNRGALFVSRNNAATWTVLSEASLGPLTSISRHCAGGALLSTTSQGVTSSPDFGQTWSAPQLTRTRQLINGPACAVYAVRATTSDAFAAKLSPRGEVLWSTFLGGMDRDAAVSIVPGPNGNVYVAGSTASPDFPTTTPRTSQPARRDVFLTRFDKDGNLIYSSVFGGEFDDSPTTLSVDAAGYAYLAGAGGFTGFASKVAPDGRVLYTTNLPYRTSFGVSASLYLSVPPSPLPITAGNDGTALIAGSGETLSRLSADGATIDPVATLPGPIQFLATDTQGDIYAAGQITAGPTASATCFYGYVNHQTTYMPAADTYIAKLKSGTLEPIFTRRLAGACRTQPTVIAIGPTGEIALGLWTLSSFPLRDPVMATPARAAIVLLSANGDELRFSTYATQASALAFGENDALFTAVPLTSSHAAVVHLPVRQAPTLSIESIADSLSGYKSAIRSGSLVTISGQGFTAAAIDQGLATPGPLPRRLGGVQVLFNGVPAEILQAAPTHVICVAPAGLTYFDSVTVQVRTETEESTPFLIAGDYPRAALLTRAFPAPPSVNADGEIRNADGTQNSPANPAARGTIVTLFATGVTKPGQIELAWSPKPPRPPPGPTGPGPVYGAAGPMPGFLPLLSEIKFTIPTALGPGVDYLPVPGVTTRVEIALGSVVGIWIK